MTPLVGAQAARGRGTGGAEKEATASDRDASPPFSDRTNSMTAPRNPIPLSPPRASSSPPLHGSPYFSPKRNSISLASSHRGFVPSPPLPSSPASVTLSLSSSSSGGEHQRNVGGGGSAGGGGSGVWFPTAATSPFARAPGDRAMRSAASGSASDSTAGSDADPVDEEDAADLLDFSGSGSGSEDTNTSVSVGSHARSETTATTTHLPGSSSTGAKPSRPRRPTRGNVRAGPGIRSASGSYQRSPTFSDLPFSGGTAAESLSSHLTQSRTARSQSSASASPRAAALGRGHSRGYSSATSRHSFSADTTITLASPPPLTTATGGYESFSAAALQSVPSSSMTSVGASRRRGSSGSNGSGRPRSRTQSTPFLSFFGPVAAASSSSSSSPPPQVADVPILAPDPTPGMLRASAMEKAASSPGSTRSGLSGANSASATSAGAGAGGSRMEGAGGAMRRSRSTGPAASYAIGMGGGGERGMSPHQSATRTRFSGVPWPGAPTPSSSTEDDGPPSRPSGLGRGRSSSNAAGSKANLPGLERVISSRSRAGSERDIRAGAELATQAQQQQQQQQQTPQEEGTGTQQQQQKRLQPSPSRHLDTTQLEAKVVFLGMQGVGKTSMVHRYTSGQFAHGLNSTIGASFCIKKLAVDGCTVRLQIWDTAGQERFRSMAPMYYRGANAAIIVYDITNEESFLDIEKWLNELREMGDELAIAVIGSKADLAPTQRRVWLRDAQRQVDVWTSTGYDKRLDSSSSSAGVGAAGEEGARVIGLGGRAKAISFGGLSFGRVRKSGDTERSRSGDSPAPDTPPPGRWGKVVVTEVSAKDDFGIEEVLLTLARQLVAHKAEISHQQYLRSRNSVVIHEDSASSQSPSSSNPRLRGRCCV